MFRIGEFSKIAQVSARQLRHYDKLGLLTPEHTDPFTGYRYYTAGQLPRLNRILALKELGLTLEQIARMLNEEVPTSEIRGMLAMKKAQLEQHLLEEVARFRYIESRIKQIDNEGALEDYELVVKSVPEQWMLGLRELCTDLAKTRAMAFEMGRLLPAKVGENAVGNLVAEVHSDMFEFDEIDMTIGYLIDDSVTVDSIKLSDGREMTPHVLPAVETMVTSIRMGPFEEGHGSYSALGIWMEANGYMMDGPGREVIIVPAYPGREDEAVTEVQFPVKKIDTQHTLLA